MTTTQERINLPTLPVSRDEKLVGLLSELTAWEDIRSSSAPHNISEEDIATQEAGLLSGLDQKKLIETASHVVNSRMEGARNSLLTSEEGSDDAAAFTKRLNILWDIEELLPEDNGYATRLKRIGHSVVEDVSDSDNKTRTLVSGGAAVVTQVFDRLRYSVVLVPEVAVDVLKSSHNASEAALAGGGLFAIWCLGVGGTLTEGLAEYPKTVTAFSESFPGFMGVLEDSLPGLNKPEKSSNNEENTSRARRVGNTAISGVKQGAMFLREGFTTVGIGNTAYVGTASTQGRSRKDIHELSAETGLAGGLAAGLVVGVVAETIIKIGNSHPEWAQHIQNVASNPRLWYAVAAGLMAVNFAGTRLSRSKDAEPMQSELKIENKIIEELA